MGPRGRHRDRTRRARVRHLADRCSLKRRRRVAGDTGSALGSRRCRRHLGDRLPSSGTTRLVYRCGRDEAGLREGFGTGRAPDPRGALRCVGHPRLRVGERLARRRPPDPRTRPGDIGHPDSTRRERRSSLRHGRRAHLGPRELLRSRGPGGSEQRRRVARRRRSDGGVPGRSRPFGRLGHDVREWFCTPRPHRCRHGRRDRPDADPGPNRDHLRRLRPADGIAR